MRTITHHRASHGSGPHTPRDISRTPLQPLPTPINTVNFASFVDGHIPVQQWCKVSGKVTHDDLTRLGRERRAQEAPRGLVKEARGRKGTAQEQHFNSLKTGGSWKHHAHKSLQTSQRGLRHLHLERLFYPSVSVSSTDFFVNFEFFLL